MHAGVKALGLAADHCPVDYVHTCPFCGWAREAETAVVLPAGCPDCGCPVDSEPRSEAERRALDALATAPPPALAIGPGLRALAWLLAICFACAAARVGYVALGVSGAVTAVGVAGFLLLPFVPERLGSSAGRTA
jgi:hypothetical protein